MTNMVEATTNEQDQPQQQQQLLELEVLEVLPTPDTGAPAPRTPEFQDWRGTCTGSSAIGDSSSSTGSWCAVGECFGDFMDDLTQTPVGSPSFGVPPPAFTVHYANGETVQRKTWGVPMVH
jgi:hypothetical protein